MATTIGVINPYRYRGYRYDVETGLYYVTSRYYDPNIGRFLNADAILSPGTGLTGTNLFIYAANNPVVNVDIGGFVASFNTMLADTGGSICMPPPKNKVKETVDNMINDFRNFDIGNIDENVVLNSNYLSAYKGQLVVRADLAIFSHRSGSFGIMVLDRLEGTEKLGGISSGINTVKHEYGHFVQLKKYGIIYFTFNVAIPSVFSDAPPDVYYYQPWEREADRYGGVTDRPGYYPPWNDLTGGGLC